MTVETCFFTSDLHGRRGRYEALFDLIRTELPRAVFLGGDLLPHVMDRGWTASGDEVEFVADYLFPRFEVLRREVATPPRVFLILGNDDPSAFEEDLEAGQRAGLWEYVHGRSAPFGPHTVYGYNCVPPTPFLMKDWERYDVSRYVDPGCVPPEEGRRSDGWSERRIRLATISRELEDMTGQDDLSRAILLMHCPPHATALDLAALEGRSIDHVPLDPHVGSIAIRRLIEERQPLLTLHGHVHESTDRSGEWRERLGGTWAFNGACCGPGLTLIRFDPSDAASARREVVPPIG